MTLSERRDAGVSRPLQLALGGLMASAALALFLAEKKRPLREPTQREPRRTIRNLAIGAMSLATVAAIERPVADPLARRVQSRRWGLAQRLSAPAWLRDTAAFLLLDYTMYLWHVLTHRVPALWRFHLVHHVDLDMDTTTALRFHFADMAISVSWRVGQILLCGASPRALKLWQSFFFVSVLFHHSNLRLPLALEQWLARLITTPRLHGIHHSAVFDQTNSNWSSGFVAWDWLHGTRRFDVPQERIAIGVPTICHPEQVALGPSLRLPFGTQPDAWAAPARMRSPR